MGRGGEAGLGGSRRAAGSVQPTSTSHPLRARAPRPQRLLSAKGLPGRATEQTYRGGLALLTRERVPNEVPHTRPGSGRSRLRAHPLPAATAHLLGRSPGRGAGERRARPLEDPSALPAGQAAGASSSRAAWKGRPGSWRAAAGWGPSGTGGRSAPQARAR